MVINTIKILLPAAEKSLYHKKMIDNFPAFAKLVAERFQDLAKRPILFVTDIEGDVLYAQYLRSFPAGTNKLFKTHTEHDCSCCRHFIRRIGAVIAIDNDTIHTIWDTVAASSTLQPYTYVAEQLRDLVRQARILDIFKVSTKENSFGAKVSHSHDKKTQSALTWNHLYTDKIPRNCQASSPDKSRGDYLTTVQVFDRGLRELTPTAIETVLELINTNNLYRGEEHKTAILAFQKAQQEYLTKDIVAKQLFVWSHANEPFARFRNTVLGTLVQDLSEGQDVEQAVRSFESKVAPQNYKRPTAIITPGMVKKAMETVEMLGLEPALERRFAVIGDISINDVKWVDNNTKNLLKGGLTEALLTHAIAINPKNIAEDANRAEEINIDDFLSRILPETTHMDVFFTSELCNNLMSLTAPVHPKPAQLFRWANDFAWSYRGNVTDSIKERVKKAGGKIDGVLRVSLSWFNYDDLDLHIIEPNGRGLHVFNHIYFANRTGWTGGVLDVDMNAHAGGFSREPVENVIWSNTIPDGVYKVQVNNYRHRESIEPGFVVEIENRGKVSHFSYNKTVREKQTIDVALFETKNQTLIEMEICDPGITASNLSQTVWGLTTNQYVKVNAVTFSPNYWNNCAIGNKHVFFLLDGAKNNEPTRGIYNEYLHPRLEPHRKVFEIIGDKTKCQPTDSQLSGVGFSITKPASFLVKVMQGKKQRLFNVHVGQERTK